MPIPNGRCVRGRSAHFINWTIQARQANF
ncbi:hypothetical protein BVI1335_1010013 [Burkholderia vietnamiensis]|nr:hypothetical protein BVI1335_1010013 [Burkholderia vietnamiensis]